MGSNVFGTPITDNTLKGMSEYHDKDIKRADRARVAFKLKNAEGKDENALKFAENLREAMNDDGTMCLFYNATGDAVELVGYHNTWGKLYRSPYPTIIENGQWGVFLHGHLGHGSCHGQVVYAGKNNDGAVCQWAAGWYQANGESFNRCYLEIRPENYYSSSTGTETWEALSNLTRYSGIAFHHITETGCEAYASIGNMGTTVLEVIMTLQHGK